jgi:dihydroorotase-like cyclic amidohydrolase
MLAAALPLAAQQYDLLIQGGRVIDPANGIDAVMDVAVLGETIARVAKNIPPDQAKKIIDASGAVVTPGLIDLHAHVYGYSGSIFPDDTALYAGTTTVVDCGGAGWRGDGKELFYVVDNALMAVPVTTAGGFTAGEPQRLFEAAPGAFVGRGQQYTVTPDGQKFILVEDADGDRAAMPTIQVTQNWFPEFKGRQRE